MSSRRAWPWPLIPLLVAALGAVAVAVTAWQVQANEQQRAREVVLTQLQTIKAQLDQAVLQSFGPTLTLAALIQDDGRMDAERFERVAREVPWEALQLRSLAAAPNDVVRFVSPLAGNEAVQNLDYQSIPAQYAQVQRARHWGGPLIAAPVPLVQGGVGIVQRRPVFVRDPQGEPRYWGVVSAVADRDAFLRRVGWPHAQLSLAVFEVQANGALGGMIGGDAGLHTPGAVSLDAQLPGARWQLRARPQGGWPAGWPWRSPLVALLALASLAITGLTTVWSRQRHRLALSHRDLLAEAELRAQAQAQSEALQARFQALARLGSDWFWELDTDLRLTRLDMGDEHHALPLRHVIGHRRWEAPGVLPDAAWERHREQLERREAFRDFEYRLRAPSGQVLTISVSGEPVFDAEGQFQGYRGVGRDLTPIRRAEHELAEARDALARTRDHLQSLLDSATDIAIIATDPQGRITDFSRGAELLLGYRAHEVIGSSPHRFHDPQEMADRAEALAARLGHPVAPAEVFVQGRALEERSTWTYVRADGRRVPVSLTVSELKDRRGQAIGHLGVAVDISTLISTQDALTRTAERLQSVLDSAEDVAIVALDRNGRVQLFNRGAERLLGCTASAALGRSPRRFHLAVEIEAESQRLASMLGRPVPWHEVFERQAEGLDAGHTRIWTYVRLDDGTQIRVSHSFHAVRNSAGEVTGYISVAHDVTERVDAEDRLRATNARLEAVLNAADEIAVVAMDPQGRVMLFNRGAERLLGYSAAEMLGARPERLYDPEAVQQRLRQWSDRLGRPVAAGELVSLQAAAAEGSRTQVFTFVARSGTRLKVSVTLAEMRDDQGTFLGHVAIARDVTTALSHESALRDTRDRLQAVLDSALDVAILVVSLRGKVELFSRGAERMFGYGQHEVIGRSTLMFHDPAELQARADARTAELGRPVGKSEMMMLLLDAGGQSSLSHWTFVRKSGERLNAALRFSRMTDPDGRVLGFLAVVLDVSAQVQAQQALQTLNTELERRVTERTQELAQAHEELVRSDKLAALGSMVAGVSHELNTPIGTSLTAASTLSDRCQELRNALSSNTVRRSTLEAFLQDTQALGDLLQRSLLNAADLVQHFKQLSADQTSEQRRSFRLDQVVEDVVTVTRPQLKQGGLRLHTDIEPDLWMDSYPGALGRVLTNLLINAQLHAFEGREGGQVHIRAKRLPDQAAVQLLVADDGQGMSAEVARRAFDPFFTTKLGRGGTGLGLNIVHNVATVILGGSLHLDTAPGQGTCFVFELPLSAPNDTSPGDNLTGYRASGWDPLKRTNGAR